MRKSFLRATFLLLLNSLTVSTVPVQSRRDVDEIIQKAVEAMGGLERIDKYDHALAIFHQIVTENPSSAEPYGNLGEAYLQEKDKKKAISAFQRAIDLGLKDDDIRRKLIALCEHELCSKTALN